MRLDTELEPLTMRNFRVAPEVMERVKERADEMGTTPSDVIRRCIAVALEDLR